MKSFNPSFQSKTLVLLCATSLSVNPLALAEVADPAQVAAAQPQPVQQPLRGPQPQGMVARPDGAGTDAVSSSSPRNIHLDLQQAKQNLIGLKVERIGTASDPKARISFRVFKECAADAGLDAGMGLDKPQLTFWVNRTLSSRNQPGFIITDLPAQKTGKTLAECQASRKTTQTCQMQNSCFLVTQTVDIPQTPITDLREGEKQSVAIFQESLETYELEAESIPGTEYKTIAEISQEKRAEREAKRRDQIEAAQTAIRECGNNLVDLPIAHEGIDFLASIGEMTQDEAEEAKRGLGEHELLANSAKAACNAGSETERKGSRKLSSDSLRSRAQALVRKDPDLADFMVKEFYQALIACTLSEEDGRTVGKAEFAEAEELLAEAAELDGGASSRALVKDMKEQLKIGKVALAARQGEQGAAEYLPARMRMEQEMRNNLNRCMSRAKNQMSAMLCNNQAMQSQQMLSRLDQQYQAATQAQYQAMQGQFGGQFGQQGQMMGGQFGQPGQVMGGQMAGNQFGGWGQSNFQTPLGAAPGFSYGGPAMGAGQGLIPFQVPQNMNPQQMGQMPIGQMPMGQMPMGQMPMQQMPVQPQWGRF
jgi:hypothetical protein